MEPQAFITVRNEVAKVMFLQASVCPQGGGEYLTRHPLPQGPGTPPGTRYTPQTRYTPRTRYTPLDQVHPLPPDQVHPPGPGTPPDPGTPPPRPRYGHCCGRYASYWNAFLFDQIFRKPQENPPQIHVLTLCPNCHPVGTTFFTT